MFIELGSMLSLKIGKAVYEELEKDERVTYVFLENGRSNDLFEKEIFEKIFETSRLTDENNGIQYTSSSLAKTSFEGPR